MAISRSHAPLRGAAATAIVALFVACSTPRAPAPPPPAAVTTTPAAPRLELDASLSPVPFRWLQDDVVLVAPDVGNRKLAAFGNYVEHAARKRERVRLAVWDDEAAWKAAHQATDESEGMLAHKRALFVKNTAGPSPVDHYTTFGTSGEILYERDFRTYPLSDFDKDE